MAQPMSQVQIILDANTSAAQRNIAAFQSQIGAMVGAVQNVNQGFINSAKIINNFRVAAQKASQQTSSMASALRGLSSAGMAIAGMFAGHRLQDGFRTAMGMVDDYRKQVLAIATTLTDTVSGDPDRIRDVFAQNTRHAEKFFRLLQTQSAKSIATFEELANAYQMFTAKGLSLAPTAASAQMLANIVDRILLATKGQASQVQVFQELRAILNGTSRPGDVTASIFKMHDPNYLQRIRAIYQTSQNPGQDLIKYLNTLTSGMDMSDVLGQVLSKAFARIKTNIHVWVLDAFSPIYDRLVVVASQVADFLSEKNNPFFRGLEEVRDFMVGLAGAVKTVWDALGPMQGVLISLAPKLLAVGSAMAAIATATYAISMVASALETAAGVLGLAAGPVGWGLAAAGATMVVSDMTKQGGATIVDASEEKKALVTEKLWDDFAVGFQIILEGIKRFFHALWISADTLASKLILSLKSTISSVELAFDMVVISLQKASHGLVEGIKKVSGFVTNTLVRLGIMKKPEEDDENRIEALDIIRHFNKHSGRKIPLNFNEGAERTHLGWQARKSLYDESWGLASLMAVKVNRALARGNESEAQAELATGFKNMIGIWGRRAAESNSVLNPRIDSLKYLRVDPSGKLPQEMSEGFINEHFHPVEALARKYNDALNAYEARNAELEKEIEKVKRKEAEANDIGASISDGRMLYDVLEMYVKGKNPNHLTLKEWEQRKEEINGKAITTRAVPSAENFEAVSGKLEAELQKNFKTFRDLVEYNDRLATEAEQYGARGRLPEASANIQLQAARARIDRMLPKGGEGVSLKEATSLLDIWRNNPEYQNRPERDSMVEKYLDMVIGELQQLIAETQGNAAEQKAYMTELETRLKEAGKADQFNALVDDALKRPRTAEGGKGDILDMRALDKARKLLDYWTNSPFAQKNPNRDKMVKSSEDQVIQEIKKLLSASNDLIMKQRERTLAEAGRVASLKRTFAYSQEADKEEGRRIDLLGKMAGFAQTSDEQARLSSMQKVMEIERQVADFQREISGKSVTEAEAKERLRQEQERYNSLLPQALQNAQQELEYQQKLLDLRTQGGALNGVKAAVMTYSHDIKSTFENVQDMALKCIQTVQSSLSDALFNVMTGQFDQFKDFFKSFVNSIIRIWTDAISQLITQWLVLKLALGLGLNIATAGASAAGSAITGGVAQTSANMAETSSTLSNMSISLRDTSWASGASGGLHLGGGLANGGIFQGGFHAFANGGMVKGGKGDGDAVVELPRIPGVKTAFDAFATGGTVHSPTIGLVGEGRYNEAIVPLPDGRSIPVVQKGPGVNVSVNVPEQTFGGRAMDFLARTVETVRDSWNAVFSKDVSRLSEATRENTSRLSDVLRQTDISRLSETSRLDEASRLSIAETETRRETETSLLASIFETVRDSWNAVFSKDVSRLSEASRLDEAWLSTTTRQTADLNLPARPKGLAEDWQTAPEWPSLPEEMGQRAGATPRQAVSVSPNVVVNINDNSGAETAKTVNQREDDDGNLIIDVVIDALARNKRGFRRTLRQYAGGNA